MHHEPEMIPEEKGIVKATKEYYRGYPLDINIILRKAGNNILTVFNEKSRVVTREEARTK